MFQDKQTEIVPRCGGTPPPVNLYGRNDYYPNANRSVGRWQITNQVIPVAVGPIWKPDEQRHEKGNDSQG
jgi:hypothetical protein